jgi:hypothetical protein
MPQEGQQILRFSGTIQAVSPYAVPQQALTVLLPSTDIHEHSKPQASGSANVSGMKVLYTGLKNTGAFGAEPLELRYRSEYPFIHFLSVDRVITVCASLIVPSAPFEHGRLLFSPVWECADSKHLILFCSFSLHNRVVTMDRSSVGMKVA